MISVFQYTEFSKKFVLIFFFGRKGIWSFLWIYPLTSCLENPTAEEPGRLQSMGLLGVGHD